MWNYTFILGNFSEPRNWIKFVLDKSKIERVTFKIIFSINSEHLLSPYYMCQEQCKCNKYIKWLELIKSGTGGRWEVYSPLRSLLQSSCSTLFLDDLSKIITAILLRKSWLFLFLVALCPLDWCSWNIAYLKKVIFLIPRRWNCWVNVGILNAILFCVFSQVASSFTVLVFKGESPRAAMLLWDLHDSCWKWVS